MSWGEFLVLMGDAEGRKVLKMINQELGTTDDEAVGMLLNMGTHSFLRAIEQGGDLWDLWCNVTKTCAERYNRFRHEGMGTDIEQLDQDAPPRPPPPRRHRRWS